MQTVLRDRDLFILELSGYECHIIGTALRHAVVLPLGEGDEQFPRRFGWPNSGEFPTRQELRLIESRMPNSHEDGTFYTEAFTKRELSIIVRGLSELANGILIPEWEFHMLTGTERQDVQDLLDSLHRLLVGERG